MDIKEIINFLFIYNEYRLCYNYLEESDFMNKKIIMTFLVMFCAFFGINSIKADTTTVYKYCYGNNCRYLAKSNSNLKLYNDEASEIFFDTSNNIFTANSSGTAFMAEGIVYYGNDELPNFDSLVIKDKLYYTKIHCTQDIGWWLDHDSEYRIYSYYTNNEVFDLIKKVHQNDYGETKCTMESMREFYKVYDTTTNVDINLGLFPAEIIRIHKETKDIIDTNHDSIDITKNMGCAVLSDKIKDKINWALNLIKYGGAALVIILGSVDFLKATLSDEDNASKKAFEKFIKRLIAAILLFLLPLLIQLLFTTVNNPVIKIPGFNVDSPTCGIGVSE